MAIKAVNLHRTIVFESENDPDKGTAKATQIMLRVLSSREQAYLNDNLLGLNDSGDSKLAFNKTGLELIRIACTDMKNYMGANDKPVQFRTERSTVVGKAIQVVHKEIMESFPTDVAAEAYRFYMEETGLTPEDEKKEDEQ